MKTRGSFGSRFAGLTFQEGSSLLHRLHSMVKVVLLLSFSVTVFAVPSLWGMLLLLILQLVSYQAAGLGFGFYLGKLRYMLLFGLFMMLAQALWVKQGVLLWSLEVGVFSLTLWSEGLVSGLRMALRFINVIGASYLFVSVTNPNRMAYALMQAGLPYRGGFMLITALRFIPLFHLELAQIRSAQMAKGIDLEGLSPGKLVKSVRYLLVPLVVSVLGRVDTLTVSMESRAFGLYENRTYREDQPLTRLDQWSLAVIPLMFGFFVFYQRLKG